jgi:hypothetical protein
MPQVWMVGGWDRGCCGDVAGVYSDHKKGLAARKKANKTKSRETGLTYYLCKLVVDGAEGVWESEEEEED